MNDYQLDLKVSRHEFPRKHIPGCVSRLYLSLDTKIWEVDFLLKYIFVIAKILSTSKRNQAVSTMENNQTYGNIPL